MFDHFEWAALQYLTKAGQNILLYKKKAKNFQKCVFIVDFEQVFDPQRQHNSHNSLVQVLLALGKYWSLDDNKLITIDH